jgi:hypothetical protein
VTDPGVSCDVCNVTTSHALLAVAGEQLRNGQGEEQEGVNHDKGRLLQGNSLGMGKAKNKKESITTKAASCTCADPYQCDCGRRPPRPSKGHKWDSETQTWGGKGHKQKGASGQISSVSVSAQTTAVGKTVVAQWQRMPSQLLVEICQRQNRKEPRYKSLDCSSEPASLFRYRVVVPDPKDPKKDLFFVPAKPVANAEQAKEESALLALLQITPKLPHERKLPEPYKTTWLNAVAAVGAKIPPVTTKMEDGDTCVANSAAAQASTNLAMQTSYSSLAEKMRNKEERRRKENARIRVHEAIRLANRDHPVFMSSWVRKQIENLLRGDAVRWDEEDNDEQTLVDDSDDATQLYVEKRLHSEGFTRRQARTAFQQIVTAAQKALVDESGWDAVYEGCLQWLLVHLNDDQLPEGFDPRGRNLDVIVPKRSEDSPYGLSDLETRCVLELAQKESASFEDTLFTSLQKAAGVPLEDLNSSEPSDSNRQVLREEIVALESMFGPQCKVSQPTLGFTTVAIEFNDRDLILQLVICDGVYPSVKPSRVWLTGKWASRLTGAALHVELLKFMADLPTNEPMIFELYIHVQGLIESDDLSPQAILSIFGGGGMPPSIAGNSTPGCEKVAKNGSREAPTDRITRTKKTVCRPQQCSAFWSKLPSDTPPANPCPSVGQSIARVRKSLPAAGARDEFLMQLKRADKNGRVMLVTGDTGCGKTTQIPQVGDDSENVLCYLVRRWLTLCFFAVTVHPGGLSKRGQNSSSSAPPFSCHRCCISRCRRERRKRAWSGQRWLCGTRRLCSQ